MKIKKKRLTFQVCLISFVTSFFLLSISAAGYSAEISIMGGDVKVVRNGKESKAQFKMKVDSGDLIKTGKGAFAEITYKDGSVIKLQQNSSVKIGSQNVEGSDSLSVTSGIIAGKFSKLSKEEPRKVYTPTTVCSVRGTEFNIAVSEGADSRVELTEGALDVGNPYGTVAIDAGKNAEIGVAKSPQKAGSANLIDWKTSSDNQLDSNPQKKSEAFDIYIKNFGKRSADSSKQINKLDKDQKTAAAGGKVKMEKANKQIEGVEGSVEDDMYLNEASNTSINGILNRFQKDKKDMYSVFQRIKEESNKVNEQLKKNYEAIKAVKEAYRKAYEEIMRKHKEAVEKIKGSIDTDQYKKKGDK